MRQLFRRLRSGYFALLLSVFIGGNARAQQPDIDANGNKTAEVSRVIVTGSNIPTAQEVGPNPVDTYRKDDITRFGVRSSTDLIQKLPAATGSTINENNTNGGGGRGGSHLRGILAKETLVLLDGGRLG